MGFGPPAKDIEYAIAHELLGKKSPLDRQILEALMGQPSRYGALKPLLAGHNENVLTKALARLRERGVIKQGVDLDSKDRTYSLTNLGKLVIFRMHEMIPVERSLEVYGRGLTQA